jgi:hypothetical protein
MTDIEEEMVSFEKRKVLVCIAALSKVRRQ